MKTEQLEKLQEYIKSKPQRMEVRFSKEQLAAANPEEKTIPCSFAAMSYVERWYGILVLDMSPEAVDLSRWSEGVAYLMDHNHTDQRGIITNGRLENGQLVGDVKFSKSEKGQELFNDIKDGIRPWTSVGFDIYKMEEVAPEEMPDDLKNLCLERECGAFSVKKWAPYEGSSVSIPANPGVGVMPSGEGDEEEEMAKMAEAFGIQKFSKKQSESNHQITIQKEDTMSDVKKTPEQLATEKKTLIEFGVANYENRVAGGKETIERLANDVVALFANDETTDVESRFRGELFTRIQDKERLETPKTFVGMTESQKAEYSIIKVIASMVDGKPLTGFEKEVADELDKKGVTSRTGGVVLPLDLQSRKINFDAELNYHLAKAGIRTERFAQTVGSTTGGGYLVGTEHRAQDFVEIYRNFLIPGFTYLPGLSQSVDIPKQTGGSTITVAASEAAGFNATALVFGQLTLSPKEIGAYIEITRRLLVQSSPAIDNLVVIDLMRQMALKTNYLALFGSGGSGEPTGAFQTANIGTFDGTGLGRSGALDAMADIGTANVVGQLYWLCNSAVKALLMGRDQTTGFGSWLMNDNGSMVGFPSIISEQMSGTSLALIKPDEVVVGSFGTMEINYDRATLSASGGLRIAAYDLIDAGLKHPGAVSYASSVS
jgi:HK97 family phage major capsid protein